jgi:hypothetical protein
MFKKIMLAGLMGATVLGGIVPAYAQERAPRGERGMRNGEGAAVSRGNRMNQPRGNAGRAAGTQPRAQPPRQMAPAQPDNRLRGNAARAVEQARERREQWQAGRAERRPGMDDRRGDRRDGRQDWRNERQDRRADRRDDRQDQRADRQGDRRDWRSDRRDDRIDWRNDRRGARPGDWRWTGGRERVDVRRFDERTRWNNQRRWDNGWRQDRRYDWRSYRNRYGDRYRVGRYYAPRGWSYGYRSFSVGLFLNDLLYANNYWINDPYAYRLPPAYGTLRWIRYYDDALLVDVRDGYVVDVIRDFFW